MLRGLVKTAVVWAVASVPLALIPFGLWLLTGSSLPTNDVLQMVLLSAVLGGALNGIVFGGIVALAGRRKSFADVSLPWIAVCGAIGATLLPAIALAFAESPLPVSILARIVVGNAVAGATLATVSLAVARRAPQRLGDGAAAELLESDVRSTTPA